LLCTSPSFSTYCHKPCRSNSDCTATKFPTCKMLSNGDKVCYK
jgi:hypothetical protein